MKIGKYFEWKKGVDFKITKYFGTDNGDKTECQCSFSDCEMQKINIEMLERLDQVRDALGIPLFITSGFRCNKKQKQLRGSGIKTAVGTSAHELGDAVDVTIRDKSRMPDLLAELEKHFQSIGIAKTFYHVDMRMDKKRRWDY